MARFEVHEVLRRPLNQEVLITGRVIEGKVHAGQSVCFNLTDKITCCDTLVGVEFLDRVAAKETLVVLRIKESAPEAAEVYSDLCPMGTILRIDEPDTGQGEAR